MTGDNHNMESVGCKDTVSRDTAPSHENVLKLQLQILPFDLIDAITVNNHELLDVYASSISLINRQDAISLLALINLLFVYKAFGTTIPNCNLKIPNSMLYTMSKLYAYLTNNLFCVDVCDPTDDAFAGSLSYAVVYGDCKTLKWLHDNFVGSRSKMKILFFRALKAGHVHADTLVWYIQYITDFKPSYTKLKNLAARRQMGCVVYNYYKLFPTNK